MEKKTIRLIYPQWQEADIERWIMELAPEDASRGYYLGSMPLEFLAPKSACETFRVPASTDSADIGFLLLLDVTVPASIYI